MLKRILKEMKDALKRCVALSAFIVHFENQKSISICMQLKQKYTMYETSSLNNHFTVFFFLFFVCRLFFLICVDTFHFHLQMEIKVSTCVKPRSV